MVFLPLGARERDNVVDTVYWWVLLGFCINELYPESLINAQETSRSLGVNAKIIPISLGMLQSPISRATQHSHNTTKPQSSPNEPTLTSA